MFGINVKGENRAGAGGWGGVAILNMVVRKELIDKGCLRRKLKRLMKIDAKILNKI